MRRIEWTPWLVVAFACCSCDTGMERRAREYRAFDVAPLVVEACVGGLTFDDAEGVGHALQAAAAVPGLSYAAVVVQGKDFAVWGRAPVDAPSEYRAPVQRLTKRWVGDALFVSAPIRLLDGRQGATLLLQLDRHPWMTLSGDVEAPSWARTASEAP